MFLTLFSLGSALASTVLLSPSAPVDKATKAAKAVQKGTRVVKRKIRTTPRFTRPHTLRLKTSPKYAQVAVPKTGGLDKFSIIQRPIFSEANMREIEKQNTLTFIVDPRANKRQISLAIKALYNVDVVKVNTLIRYVSMRSQSHASILLLSLLYARIFRSQHCLFMTQAHLLTCFSQPFSFLSFPFPHLFLSA